LIDEDACGISRDAFMGELHKRGIGSGVHYRALHLHAYYKERFGFAEDDFPEASWVSNRTVSLPLSAKLTDDEVERIIGNVTDLLTSSQGSRRVR